MEETFSSVINFDEVIHTDEDTLTIRGYANKYTNANGATIIDSHNTTFKGIQYDMSEYLKNPILFYAHDLHDPVGRVTKLEVRADGLYVEAVVFKSINSKVYSMVKNKVVRSFSVGVVVTDYEWSDMLSATIYTKGRLFDISLIGLPSNDESTIETIDMCSLGQCTAVRKKLDDSTKTNIVDSVIIETITRNILKR